MIKGTVENGAVLPAEPIRWPNGTEVVISVASPADEEVIQSNDPEAIEDWISWYRSLQPWQMSAEEEARLEADRQRRKAEDKARFEADAKRAAEVWD